MIQSKTRSTGCSAVSLLKVICSDVWYGIMSFKVDDIIKAIKIVKWQWEGHISRREDNRWTERMTDWEITDTERLR